MLQRIRMKNFILRNLCLLALLGTSFVTCRAAELDTAENNVKPLRVGIIGLDTSHAIVFTDMLNNPKASKALAGCPVVAAYPPGSPDIESSTSRIPKYTAEMRKKGIEIVDSIDALLTRVDVVLLETNDGRPHLEQVLPVLKAGKPVFIDKPVAGSLVDAVAIYDEARRLGVPLFSASSLRFGRKIQAMRHGAVGKIVGCDAYGSSPIEPTHPDLFWYGIHGVETLYTIMGTGCQRVTRTKTAGTDFVVGEWEGGRVGTFRGIRSGHHDIGGTAFGTEGIQAFDWPDGYEPLLIEVVKFFRTGKPPVSAEETLEMFAFMEAADESNRRGGVSVSIDLVLQQARDKVKKRN